MIDALQRKEQTMRAPDYPNWHGETALVIGGGPSVNDVDCETLRRFDGRIVAINEAGLTVVPCADLFYWTDAQWYKWNHDRYTLNRSPWRYTSANGNFSVLPRTQHIHTDNGKPFSLDPAYVMGADGGSRVINLLWHCGVREIYLIGFDMWDYPMKEWRKGNFHARHQRPPQPGSRQGLFVQTHQKIADQKPESLAIYNATPNSALVCYPSVSWEVVASQCTRNRKEDQ